MRHASIAIRPTAILLAALAVCLLLAAGCKDDEVAPPPVESDLPTTPDELMDDFVEAYGNLDADAYAAVLADSFRFRFLQSDVDALNLPSDHLDREGELACATRMFSGQPGIDPLTGDPVAGVSDITFELFHRAGDWADTDDEVNFPDTQKALYDCQLSFLRPGSTTFIVSGQAKFYVEAAETTVGGHPVTRYELRGWVDLSASRKATEDATWGGVKVLYR